MLTRLSARGTVFYGVDRIPIDELYGQNCTVYHLWDSIIMVFTICPPTPPTSLLDVVITRFYAKILLVLCWWITTFSGWRRARVPAAVSAVWGVQEGRLIAIFGSSKPRGMDSRTKINARKAMGVQLLAAYDTRHWARMLGPTRSAVPKTHERRCTYLMLP